MDIIIARACGLDVHKDSITACIMTPEGKEIQTFSTKTILQFQKSPNPLILSILPSDQALHF